MLLLVTELGWEPVTRHFTSRSDQFDGPGGACTLG